MLKLLVQFVGVKTPSARACQTAAGHGPLAQAALPLVTSLPLEPSILHKRGFQSIIRSALPVSM